MAEMLLMAEDNPSAKGFKRGDIVAIKPDGWAWTAQESKAAWIKAGRPAGQWPRRFAVVKIPGVSEERLRPLLDVELDVLLQPLRKRRRFLDLDGAGVAVRQQVGRDYEVTVAPGQLRSLFKQRSDLAVFDPGLED